MIRASSCAESDIGGSAGRESTEAYEESLSGGASLSPSLEAELPPDTTPIFNNTERTHHPAAASARFNPVFKEAVFEDRTEELSSIT